MFFQGCAALTARLRGRGAAFLLTQRRRAGGSGGGQAGYGNQVSGYSENENTGTHLTDGSITLATVNTGSGGGGAGNGSGYGGAGASGVVIIRYKFQ